MKKKIKTVQTPQDKHVQGHFSEKLSKETTKTRNP